VITAFLPTFELRSTEKSLALSGVRGIVDASGSIFQMMLEMLEMLEMFEMFEMFAIVEMLEKFESNISSKNKTFLLTLPTPTVISCSDSIYLNNNKTSLLTLSPPTLVRSCYIL